MTTRPIHKLVLVVPVEEQTMEDPEENGEGEVCKQEGQDGGDAEKEQEIEESALGDPPLAGSSSEKNGVDVSEEENAKEDSEKEGGLEEHGKGEEEPAASCPIVKGNLKVTHQDTIEEIKDIHQVLKRRRGRPRKVNVAAAEDHQEASSPGPGKGSVPYKEVGSCQGPGGNGVRPGEGGKGGPGPPDKGRDKQSSPSKEGGNMEQEEEGKKSQA